MSSVNTVNNARVRAALRQIHSIIRTNIGLGTETPVNQCENFSQSLKRLADTYSPNPGEAWDTPTLSDPPYHAVWFEDGHVVIATVAHGSTIQERRIKADQTTTDKPIILTYEGVDDGNEAMLFRHGAPKAQERVINRKNAGEPHK